MAQAGFKPDCSTSEFVTLTHTQAVPCLLGGRWLGSALHVGSLRADAGADVRGGTTKER